MGLQLLPPEQSRKTESFGEIYFCETKLELAESESRTYILIEFRLATDC